jgi:hypothetical protein
VPNVGSTIFEPEEGKEGNAGSLYTPKSVLMLPPVVGVVGGVVGVVEGGGVGVDVLPSVYTR